MMKLYAISDLHVGYEVNRQALEALPACPNDGLIVAGDVGETEAHLSFALSILTQRFARVLWAPGNHELWTLPGDGLCSVESAEHAMDRFAAHHRYDWTSSWLRIIRRSNSWAYKPHHYIVKNIFYPRTPSGNFANAAHNAMPGMDHRELQINGEINPCFQSFH